MTPGSVSAQSVMLPLVPMISIGSTLVDSFHWNLKPAAYADHPASFTFSNWHLWGSLQCSCSGMLPKKVVDLSSFLVLVLLLLSSVFVDFFFFYGSEDIFHLSFHTVKLETSN